MPKQLALSEALKGVFTHEGERLLSLVRDTVQRNVKQADDFAASLGIAPSALSMALNGSPGRSFNLLWLPAALHVDRDRRIASHIAALVGCELAEQRPLTVEEKWKRLRAELRRSGADVDALEARAYAEDAPAVMP